MSVTELDRHVERAEPARSMAVCILGAREDRPRLAGLFEAFDVVLVVPDHRTAQAVLSGMGPDGSQPHETVAADPRDGGATDIPDEEPRLSLLARDDVAAEGDLQVDCKLHEATWQGRPLALTRRERDIVRCLLQVPRRVWTYGELYAEVWGAEYYGDTIPVHAAVKRLRRKLRGASVCAEVESVRGIGFRLGTAAG